jgi:hypothetical protein
LFSRKRKTGRAAALVIEGSGPLVPKIALSERLAKILRYVDQADAALAAAAA